MNKVRQHNLEIQARIREITKERDAIKKECLRIRDLNEQTSRWKAHLEKELNALVETPLLALPPVPIRPPMDFDLQEFERVRMQRDSYARDLALFEDKYKAFMFASKRCSEIREEMETLEDKISKLKKMENGLKQLPQEELRRRLINFDINATVVIGDEVNIYQDGIPYHMLSTGQKIKLDIEIAYAINLLLQLPLNMMFIDDADLVDDLKIPASIQVFVSRVGDGELCVQ